jgi:hypothetical protein
VALFENPFPAAGVDVRGADRIGGGRLRFKSLRGGDWRANPILRFRSRLS